MDRSTGDIRCTIRALYIIELRTRTPSEYQNYKLQAKCCVSHCVAIFISKLEMTFGISRPLSVMMVPLSGRTAAD